MNTKNNYKNSKEKSKKNNLIFLVGIIILVLLALFVYNQFFNQNAGQRIDIGQEKTEYELQEQNIRNVESQGRNLSPSQRQQELNDFFQINE